jgi:hypothetical protein
MHPIHEFGTPAQKDKYLPPLGFQFHYDLDSHANYGLTAKGELVGCFVRISILWAIII